MKKLFFLTFVVLACKVAFVPDYALNRFESTIKTYEQTDKTQGIETGKYLFYGSSSWYFWKNIETDLAPLRVLNRGFGGSTIPELIHYADRMVYPYKPKAIVVYGGENDLSGAKVKTAEQVLESYKVFTKTIRATLPQVQFYYVSMKYSPLRRSKWAEMKRGNALIAEFSRKNGMGYIDINPLLFDDKGLVRSDLYTKDSLHINQAGYDRYAELLKRVLR